MKKLVLILILLVAASAHAFDPEEFLQFSTVKSADANAVLTGAGYLYGIVAATDGSNSVTFITYDALTATGTKVHPDWIATSSATNRIAVLSFDPPVVISTGISVDITTAGTVEYIVYYRAR